MKFFIVFAAVVAMALSAPQGNFVQVNQDTAGNYKTVFNADDIYVMEEAKNGEVVGTYSYVDDKGEKQIVKYTAGVGGFVAEGNNLPVPVVNTPEVEQSRKQHLVVYQETLKNLPITEEFYQTGEEKVVADRQLRPVIKYIPVYVN